MPLRRLRSVRFLETSSPPVRRGSRGAFWASALLLAASCSGTAVSAAEFHLFLQCEGQAKVAQQTREVRLDLALRDNNSTALIQRSNLLPVGERLSYTQTPSTYTLVYKAPSVWVPASPDWQRGGWVAWQPQMNRLSTIRLAIDRQDGSLEGSLLDAKDDVFGTLELSCYPANPQDMAPALF
jgi:hypothetical protein